MEKVQLCFSDVPSAPFPRNRFKIISQALSQLSLLLFSFKSFNTALWHKSEMVSHHHHHHHLLLSLMGHMASTKRRHLVLSLAKMVSHHHHHHHLLLSLMGHTASTKRRHLVLSLAEMVSQCHVSFYSLVLRCD